MPVFFNGFFKRLRRLVFAGLIIAILFPALFISGCSGAGENGVRLRDGDGMFAPPDLPSGYSLESIAVPDGARYIGAHSVDGYIWCVPESASGLALRLNLLSGGQTLYPLPLIARDEGAVDFAASCEYAGVIYAAPYAAAAALKIDAVTGKAEALNFPEIWSFSGGPKFSAVAAAGGEVWFFPARALIDGGEGGGFKLSAAVYSIESGAFRLESELPFDYTTGEGDAVMGAVAAGDAVWSLPAGANLAVRYNGKEQFDAEAAGPDSALAYKFKGGIYDNGFIYGAPFNSNAILKINAESGGAELIPLPEAERGEFLYGGAAAHRGGIYFAPYNAKKILLLKNDETEFISTVDTNILPDYAFSCAVSAGGEEGGVFFVPFEGGKILRLTESGGIRGRAQGAYGKGLSAGTVITAINHLGSRYETTITAGSYYNFNNIPAGRYMVSYSGTEGKAVFLTLEEGEQVRCDF